MMDRRGEVTLVGAGESHLAAWVIPKGFQAEVSDPLSCR